ncbi:hypothetical protein N7537_008617, partial [Penicillium hordei]
MPLLPSFSQVLTSLQTFRKHSISDSQQSGDCQFTSRFTTLDLSRSMVGKRNRLMRLIKSFSLSHKACLGPLLANMATNVGEHSAFGAGLNGGGMDLLGL